MKTFNQYLETKTPNLTQTERNKINNELHKIQQTYHPQIPLDDIFTTIHKIGCHPIQEDDTPWTGFLTGGAECGTEKAKNQRATIRIARDTTPLNNYLILNWCKMPTSGNYEIIAYIT